MMTPERRDQLIKNQIARAEKAITQVELCLTNDQPDMALNRIYYGMFYAMQALALKDDFETSKHQQLIGWFNKNYVHTGVFPKEFTAFIKKAFDARMDADYDYEGISSQINLDDMFADMKTFIAAVKACLEEQVRRP